MPHAAFPNASSRGHSARASTEAKVRAPLGDAPHAPAGQTSAASLEAIHATPAGAPQAGAKGQRWTVSHEATPLTPLAPAAILGRLAFAASVLVVLATLAGLVKAEPIAPAAIHVIDGDTIAVGPAHYRLVGFDTPEAGERARCPAERMLSALATRRLRQIVAGGGLDLEEVDCRCRPGTAGTKRCNHGRLCGRLTANGQDVGETLLAEGYAQPYHYDPDAPRRPASWCGRP